jgi:hypothetical protein
MWGGRATVESRRGISGQDGGEERRRSLLLRPRGTENGGLGLSQEGGLDIYSTTSASQPSNVIKRSRIRCGGSIWADWAQSEK